MIVPRYSGDRGHANHGWLDTFHTFSFAGYYDSRYMGFRVLRVINDDRVAPGQGFGMHPHKDMEIITYVLSGALEHKDSMGNGEVLRAGEVQHMSAGTGLLHSEFNPSDSEPVHLYQIWLLPKSNGIKPRYAQKKFPVEERQNKLCLVASSDGAAGSLAMHQDASLYLAALQPDISVQHNFELGRHGWVQVVKGSIRINDFTLHTGDGAAISDEMHVTLQAVDDAEALLFDLP